MNENMEFPDISGDDIEWLQEQFVKSIKVSSTSLEESESFDFLQPL